MAFLVRYQDSQLTAKHVNVTWHVNAGKKPEIPSPIIYLFADGHELEFIQARLKNIPVTLGGRCIWRGEMAQFIYDNL